MTAPRSFAREALSGAKRRAINGVMRVLPVGLSVRLQYLRAHRRWPDLAAPKRFTEGLQWLKLHGGLERHGDWVDKVVAKERVAETLGRQWITPTLWHGPRLPPREERTWPTPYVIKANHGSGWMRHVVTEADKDWASIEYECARWMRLRWHPHLHERQYEAIAPQLLVEPRLCGQSDVLPRDYKVHVFGGRAAFMAVIVGRADDLRIGVMDRDWRLLPFRLSDFAGVDAAPERPPHADEMFEAAERLARPFPYARVDFYDLPEGPRFGEITLTPSSGLLAVTPDEWDERIGAMLALPSRARKG